jgi:hypothetical protein
MGFILMKTIISFWDLLFPPYAILALPIFFLPKLPVIGILESETSFGF